MVDPRPSEEGSLQRQEEIAAAKLRIAVVLFGNRSVPGAEMVQPYRSDVRGEEDFDRFFDEVDRLVRATRPDGFGGEKRELKQSVATWLSSEPDGDATMTPVARIRRALSAVGAPGATTSCRDLWTELERRAR